MKLSCCCGLITGFILALLCAGGVYYYFYCKENPEAPAEGMQMIETGWEATKNAGDKAISTVKPFVVEKQTPATPATSPATGNQVPELITLPPAN